MTTFLKTFVTMLVLAMSHRFLADADLRVIFSSSHADMVRQWVVGIWSDIWISAALATPIYLVHMAKPALRAPRIWAAIWILLWGILTAGHQSYVGFFKQQIIPFHLPYLVDPSFMSANSSSIFELRPVLITLVGMIGAVWVLAKPKTEGRFIVSMQFVFVLMASLACHVANIRWRIQWYIPESLQTHYLEHLYAGYKTKTLIKTLSKEDVKILTQVSQLPVEIPLERQLRPARLPDSPEITALSEATSKIVSEGRKPLLITLVAESLRPADSGWTRSADDPPSLTPALDSLVASGVLFEHATSTGPVTRGGQEALWCGAMTGTDTSLMRSFPHLRIRCLPQLSKMAGDAALWAHGGDPRFDGQESFWQRQGVEHFLVRSNFASNTPKTGWGISDRALFSESSKALKEQWQGSAGKQLVAMILSVTNHIPWDLPEDAAQEIRSLTVSHPSHRTTAYFDQSLGDLVKTLKTQDMWKDSLVIIVSDHGNFEPPRNQSYARGSPFLYESLASHINLVLSGGITELLRSKSELPARVTTWTSQAQVAAFWARIAGYSTADFFDVPLFQRSPWPVVADLNQYLYLPESQKKLAKEAVLQDELEGADPTSKLAATRYRGFIQLLYESQPTRF